ncbi:type II toxin-antitoxin system RelE/ParE family toxin [Paracoccus gahaiensis]|uniref:Type II toxin-antitoxin system RelE/ParE family toxin n=1 Tax=Paracoccus gahaiensis TaxID=1706839 RepID=A0A4U0R6C4_9RHOB|nr:type II toxin-antitoxin system RelE/ParE family toxin [Paracoccus gahaiensis]TJZ89940.1 type II toxin-antitoxin system RelE/ParE family toxin [Paracoccus gahaiensis]
MSQLIWTPKALQGVQRCYRFLASQNPEAASRAVRAIREGMQIVAAQPGVGRPADKMAPEFREWLIAFGDSGYVVLYQVDGELAVVLAVKHQREAGYS